ncbi:acid protease [Stemphylium lycopersici]|uniref:Acid protease n=1 Tax=Stemphylium lycopersici TaxID=183478 RepID=A0A364NF52_STELY|nr:acid protease [Stemphylium lycopersici]
MVRSVNTLLAAAATVSASVLELPVVIGNSYSSVKFNIGTPPKEHRLLFDTGSSTIFILNTDCTETSCPDGSAPYYIRQEYNASASSSSVNLDIDASIPYLGGNVAGETFSDVFSTLDGTVDWNQTFLSANQSSWRFITADGFLGLGFSTIAEANTSTLVETLLWDGQLDEPRFGLFYGTNLTDEGVQDGVLTIGGSHEDKYVDGEVVYTPLMKEEEYQLWRAPLRSINVLVAQNPSDPNATVETHIGRLPTTVVPNGTYPDANVTWPVFGSAVFDTGAGRLAVPDEIISAMLYNLGWDYDKLLAGEERMECKHMNASWAVSLTLGEGAPEDDVSFTIRGDEFYGPGEQCQPPFDSSGANSFALVGSTFLQRYYSVYDFGADKVAEYAPRIGFGRLKKEYDYLHLSSL